MVREFRIGKADLIGAKAMTWICLAVAAAFISIPLISPRCPGEELPWLSSIFGFALFLGLAYYARKFSKSMQKMNIAIDDDGIWNIHTGRESGLIHWADIFGIRDLDSENAYEIVGRDEKTLLKISYLLKSASELKSSINEKVMRDQNAPAHHDFNMASFHIRTLIGSYLSIAIGVYMAFSGKQILLYGIAYFLAAHFIFDAIKTQRLILIEKDRLILVHPFFRRVILFSDISSINLQQKKDKTGQIDPRVSISSRKSSRDIVLATPGSQTNDLYLALKKATAR